MRRAVRLSSLLAALLLSCGSSNTPAPVLAPDFELQDANETSLTFDQLVSPRDYVGYVTAFYFGSAT